MSVPEKDMDLELNVPMHDTVHNAVHKVYFRAGLLAARESLARFVESENPTIAQSIRSNWWPVLGTDPGKPRQLRWDEIASENEDRSITHKDCDPSVEALPLAYLFLMSRQSRNKDWQEQIERDLSPQRATPATVAQIEAQGKQVRREAE